jgi:hypothetical protein
VFLFKTFAEISERVLPQKSAENAKREMVLTTDGHGWTRMTEAPVIDMSTL